MRRPRCLLLILSPEVLRHLLDDFHYLLLALAALVYLALLLDQPQFPVVEISLLFNRLDVVQKELVVPQLLREVLLEGLDERVDLVGTLLRQRIWDLEADAGRWFCTRDVLLGRWHHHVVLLHGSLGLSVGGRDSIAGRVLERRPLPHLLEALALIRIASVHSHWWTARHLRGVVQDLGGVVDLAPSAAHHARRNQVGRHELHRDLVGQRVAAALARKIDVKVHTFGLELLEQGLLATVVAVVERRRPRTVFRVGQLLAVVK